MKLLFVSMFQGINGKSSKEYSYEYYNLYLPLQKIFKEVMYYDYIVKLNELGQAGMNLDLIKTVNEFSPKVVFITTFQEQIKPETIYEINKNTLTVGYFWDDPWRKRYSQFWAKIFSFIISTDFYGVYKFNQLGINNVIHIPFFCNEDIYKNTDCIKTYDVTFVGGGNPFRKWIVNNLNKAGIDVTVFGNGWQSKELTTLEMVDVFNKSKIILNLSNNECWDIRYLASSLRAIKTNYLSIRQLDRKKIEMVKGRHFEINACGSFQLSHYAEGLEEYFDIGKEISIYSDIVDLIFKIKYYLRNESEREKIAQNGYNRFCKEHTSNNRVKYFYDYITSKL